MHVCSLTVHNDVHMFHYFPSKVVKQGAAEGELRTEAAFKGTSQVAGHKSPN